MGSNRVLGRKQAQNILQVNNVCCGWLLQLSCEIDGMYSTAPLMTEVCDTAPTWRINPTDLTLTVKLKPDARPVLVLLASEKFLNLKFSIVVYQAAAATVNLAEPGVLKMCS